MKRSTRKKPQDFHLHDLRKLVRTVTRLVAERHITERAAFDIIKQRLNEQLDLIS